nr:hypothetical protein [Micromonospora sp. DSM 115978]
MNSVLHDDLLEQRSRLRAQVEAVLRALDDGTLQPPAEREQVDLKEEAGRRSRDGTVLPGSNQNALAVEQLAREVPGMANTPGGGALVYGVT